MKNMSPNFKFVSLYADNVQKDIYMANESIFSVVI